MTPSPTSAPAPSRPGVAGTIAIAVAAVLQLGVGYLTLTSGLVAPLWAIAVLGLVWVAAVTVLVRLARTRPRAAPVVPVINAVVWFGAISLGEAVLGWTA